VAKKLGEKEKEEEMREGVAILSYLINLSNSFYINKF